MNLANKLTMIRMILVPVFLIFSLVDTMTGHIIALSIFVIASLTDKLDGYIARKYNQITDFGKFMDPLADKLLVTCALIILVEKNIFPSWIVVVIIAREFIVSGLRTLAASQGVVIAASQWGKLKTVLQMTAIIMALLSLIVSASWLKVLTTITIYLAVIATIFSGVDYFVKGKHVLKIK